jgi:FkbM family methyltransferase
MLDSVVLTLVDGVRVVVPDSLELITPYVLREQQDFFEDELPFVRQLLQSGQNVIDIGANYGVYTLSMAHVVGASGHVWAFEPTSITAKFLAQGISSNSFEHVTLEQKAVSSTPGSAQLALQGHSELNSLIHGSTPQGDCETVTLVTLDDCMDRYHWTDIDLIKMDAEGEETNIVKGGQRFFASLSPLVQYELRKTAADMNFNLIRDFVALGYDSYRLVPGLNLLVPFDSESKPDPYLLNLFCCNAVRANRLAAEGLLLRRADLVEVTDPLAKRDAGANHPWRDALAHMPYVAPFAQKWDAAESAGDSAHIHQALSHYALSRNATLSKMQRFCALETSFSQFKALCERDPSRLRLASWARVAHDIGERAVAVDALNQLLEYIQRTGSVDTSEPFIPPLERFDWIAPGESIDIWLIAAVLEQLERRERFSSFYAGASTRGRLEDIQTLGFGSPEMQRRLDLVRQRFNRTPPK